MIFNEIILDKEEMPKKYYNFMSDLDKPMAPPKGDLSVLKKIFGKSILEQETSRERFIPIPEKVREIYSLLGRPTPIYRAKRLEEKLNTPAKIFFKREDVSVVGSHKTNTAIAQAYYNKKDGFTHLTTETGAGYWGSALAVASTLFDLECKIFMVSSSYEQKPYKKYLMKFFGATVYSSPSNQTKYGAKILAKNPNHVGSLGIAISEAIELALQHEKTAYSLGSVLNHVMIHQSIIGQEAIKQMNKIDEFPDSIIACVGGGSNFAGMVFPFMQKKIQQQHEIEFTAVEPVESASLTQGKFEYDYGDSSGLTPLLKMYTLGKDFIPEPIFAQGLRYHGMSPSVSHFVKEGKIKAKAYGQKEVFQAAKIFSEAQGLVPAPESAHAIKEAINQAIECKKTGRKKTILINLSGHGLMDLPGYAKVLGFE